MSALNEIFDKRVDLPDGGHVDMLRQEDDDMVLQAPTLGEKTLGWNTHAPPPRATSQKPDSRDYQRCFVEGVPKPCSSMSARGLSGIASLDKVKSLRWKYKSKQTQVKPLETPDSKTQTAQTESPPKAASKTALKESKVEIIPKKSVRTQVISMPKLEQSHIPVKDQIRRAVSEKIIPPQVELASFHPTQQRVEPTKLPEQPFVWEQPPQFDPEVHVPGVSASGRKVNSKEYGKLRKNATTSKKILEAVLEGYEIRGDIRKFDYHLAEIDDMALSVTLGRLVAGGLLTRSKVENPNSGREVYRFTLTPAGHKVFEKEGGKVDKAILNKIRPNMEEAREEKRDVTEETPGMGGAFYGKIDQKLVDWVHAEVDGIYEKLNTKDYESWIQAVAKAKTSLKKMDLPAAGKYILSSVLNWGLIQSGAMNPGSKTPRKDVDYSKMLEHFSEKYKLIKRTQEAFPELPKNIVQKLPLNPHVHLYAEKLKQNNVNLGSLSDKALKSLLKVPIKDLDNVIKFIKRVQRPMWEVQYLDMDKNKRFKVKVYANSEQEAVNLFEEKYAFQTNRAIVEETKRTAPDLWLPFANNPKFLSALANSPVSQHIKKDGIETLAKHPGWEKYLTKRDETFSAIRGWKVVDVQSPKIAKFVGDMGNMYEKMAALVAVNEYYTNPEYKEFLNNTRIMEHEISEDGIQKEEENFFRIYEEVVKRPKNEIYKEAQRISAEKGSLYSKQTLSRIFSEWFIDHLGPKNVYDIVLDYASIENPGDVSDAVYNLYGISGKNVAQALGHINSIIALPNSTNRDYHMAVWALRLAATFGNRWKQWLDKTIDKKLAQSERTIHDVLFFLPNKKVDKKLQDYLLKNANYGVSKKIKQFECVIQNWEEILPEEWSLPILDLSANLRARCTYKGFKDKLFAAEAARWAIPSGQYPQIEKKYLDSLSLPDFHPEKSYKEGKYVGYFLKRGDVRGLFLGGYTNCCQHPMGAGAAAAWYGQTKPNSGFYVIENTENNEIIAQSFVWTTTTGLVFDSIEAKGLKGEREMVVVKMYEQASNDLVKKYGIVNVGAAYTDSSLLKRWGENKVNHVPVPKDCGYTDAKKQVTVVSSV